MSSCMFRRQYIIFFGKEIDSINIWVFCHEKLFESYYKVQIIKKLHRKVRKYRAYRYLKLLPVIKCGKFINIKFLSSELAVN